MSTEFAARPLQAHFVAPSGISRRISGSRLVERRRGGPGDRRKRDR